MRKRDGSTLTYQYDNLNRLFLVREGWTTWLNGFSHFTSGEMEGQSYEGAAAGYTSYGYDGLGRLSVANSNLPGTARDVQFTYGRNPAGQLASLTLSNDSYAWTGHYAVNRGYTTNGLNQYSAAGGASFTYDANGNLVSSGASAFVYDVDNRLTSRAAGIPAVNVIGGAAAAGVGSVHGFRNSGFPCCAASPNVRMHQANGESSMSFGTRLAEERRRLGLKQAEFAALVDTNVPKQSLYENDKRELRAPYLARLAGAGVDIVYVLTGRRSEGWLDQDPSDLLTAYLALPVEMQQAIEALARALRKEFGHRSRP